MMMQPDGVSRSNARAENAFRILAVADGALAPVLAESLSAAGYSVDSVEASPDAIRRTRGYRYDLILLDAGSEGYDPVDAVLQIRAAEAASAQERASVVAIVPSAVDEARKALLDAGVDDFLSSPFDEQALLGVAARRVDRRPVVLVADDAPENHALVSAYLEGLGYRLVLVTNGQEAVEAVTLQRVSLILMDMDMPIMNGFHATVAIRAMEGGERIPIIAMTGSEGWEARERCESAGCSDYLMKPVEYSILLSTVSTHLAASVQSAPASAAPSDESGDPDGASDAPLPTGHPIRLDVDEVVADLVPGYIEARRENVQTMRRQLQEGDYRSIESLAHRMKGSGEGYGLPEISRFGRRLERSAQKADAPALREVIDALEGYLRRIVIGKHVD